MPNMISKSDCHECACNGIHTSSLLGLEGEVILVQLLLVLLGGLERLDLATCAESGSV